MNKKETKNVLITGATGYLGGRVYSDLRNNYNLFAGCRDSSKLAKNLNVPIENVRFFDIGNSASFSGATKGMDAVIHLASMNYADCEKNKKLADFLNVEMVNELVSQSISQGVKQFIYLSTFHVYGQNISDTITEETTTHPANTYALTHYEAERFLLEQSALKKIDGKVIRLSNALGAPLSPELSAWGLVANDACLQAVKNTKIILNSSGYQKRDFIAVSCVSDALDLLLSINNLNRTEVPIYNLGSSQTISILELVEKIQIAYKDLTGKEVTIERKIDALTPDSFPSFVFSTEKIKALGFKIKTSINDELTKTLSMIIDSINDA